MSDKMEEVIQSMEELTIDKKLTCTQMMRLNANDPQRRHHSVSCEICYRRRRSSAPIREYPPGYVHKPFPTLEFPRD